MDNDFTDFFYVTTFSTPVRDWRKYLKVVERFPSSVVWYHSQDHYFTVTVPSRDSPVYWLVTWTDDLTRTMNPFRRRLPSLDFVVVYSGDVTHYFLRPHQASIVPTVLIIDVSKGINTGGRSRTLLSFLSDTFLGSSSASLSTLQCTLTSHRTQSLALFHRARTTHTNRRDLRRSGRQSWVLKG